MYYGHSDVAQGRLRACIVKEAKIITSDLKLSLHAWVLGSKGPGSRGRCTYLDVHVIDTLMTSHTDNQKRHTQEKRGPTKINIRQPN